MLAYCSQVIQMTCAFTLTVLFYLHLVQVWEILALSFFVGVLGSRLAGRHTPRYCLLLVGTEELTNAIAMNSIQFDLARILGPTL